MRILLMTLVAVFCIAPAAQAASPARPEALPAALQKAIDAKDSEAALRHLELERVIAGIFDETLPQINESVKKGEITLNPALAAVLGSFNSGNAVTRRTASIFLNSEVRKLLVYGVESGSFAGAPLPEDERMMMDGGVFAKFGDVSLARKEFSSTRLLREEGNTALIQTRLYDYGVKRAYILQLRLELVGGVWKITHINNAADLYKELLKQG